MTPCPWVGTDTAQRQRRELGRVSTRSQMPMMLLTYTESQRGKPLCNVKPIIANHPEKAICEREWSGMQRARPSLGHTSTTLFIGPDVVGYAGLIVVPTVVCNTDAQKAMTLPPEIVAKLIF
jgi:hypothetical protein